MTEPDVDERPVSHESHEALVEGSNRRQSSFEFTVQEVRGTSSAVEIRHGPQTSLMRGKGKELTTWTKNKAKVEAKSRGCIRREHKRDAMRMPDEGTQLNAESRG